MKSKKEIVDIFIKESNDDIRPLLKKIDSRELCKALVLKWRSEGYTLGQLVIKSGLSQRQVKYIINGISKGTSSVHSNNK